MHTIAELEEAVRQAMRKDIQSEDDLGTDELESRPVGTTTQNQLSMSATSTLGTDIQLFRYGVVRQVRTPLLLYVGQYTTVGIIFGF